MQHTQKLNLFTEKAINKQFIKKYKKIRNYFLPNKFEA